MPGYSVTAGALAWRLSRRQSIATPAATAAAAIAVGTCTLHDGA